MSLIFGFTKHREFGFIANATSKKGLEEPLQKILQEGQSIDELNNFPNYDPSDKLEEHEWFIVKNFSAQEIQLSFPKATSSKDQLLPKQYDDILYLLTYWKSINPAIKNYYTIQKVTPSLFLKEKLFLRLPLTDIPDVTLVENSIQLKECPDGFYFPSEDILAFRRIESLQELFPSLKNTLRTATSDEVDKFISLDLINLKIGKEKLGASILKRIPIILPMLESMSLKDKEGIKKDNREYKVNLEYEGDKPVIHSMNELMKYFNLVQERYYQTERGKEKRLATGVRKI